MTSTTYTAVTRVLRCQTNSTEKPTSLHITSAATQTGPTRLVDEFYCKDDKVPSIDLQLFAEEHEDKMFNLEME